MLRLSLRIRLFKQMLKQGYDGGGHKIWPWDALWYAIHLEWWGLS